jgi:hypothetical protein
VQISHRVLFSLPQLYDLPRRSLRETPLSLLSQMRAITLKVIRSAFKRAVDIVVATPTADDVLLVARKADARPAPFG